MKHSFQSSRLWVVLLIAASSAGCSDDLSARTGTLALGADEGNASATKGWASVWPAEEKRTTNGGAAADAAHVYTVKNRTELVRALYPDAVLADDGSFTSENGADPTPKMIYVQGTISLSTNAAGKELTLDDYACDGYDFAAFKAAYEPRQWNKQPLVNNRPPAIPACPGSQEELRRCSGRRQRAVVELKVGSNTSLLGLGSDAKIVHGGLVIGGTGTVPRPASPTSAPVVVDAALAAACGIEVPPAAAMEPAAPAPAASAGLVPVAENVIVRNITFEDAFDMFPAWDPTDSYSTPPEMADPEGLYPQCQAVFVWSMYLAFGPDGYIRYGLDDPMAALASRTASFNEYLHDPPWAAEWIVEQALAHRIDAALVLHPRRTRPASTGRLFIERALEGAGIPVLPLEADVVDPRAWDPAAARAAVSAFLDTRVLA